MFKIEKNIPFVENAAHRIEYPFVDMVKGDSFFVPVNVTSIENVRSAVSYWNTEHKTNLKVRKIYENHVHIGCRVWSL